MTILCVRQTQFAVKKQNDIVKWTLTLGAKIAVSVNEGKDGDGIEVGGDNDVTVSNRCRIKMTLLV